jgi:hypothetical protein
MGCLWILYASLVQDSPGRGRLEQEFLLLEFAHAAILDWAEGEGND